MTRWLMAGLCTAAVAAAMQSPAAAQLPVDGCWVNETSTFFMRLCIDGGAGKEVKFHWDEPGEAPDIRYVGACNGRVMVTAHGDARLVLEVPWQADACFQDGVRERLAPRVYDCMLAADDRFSCHETIYYDDGSVFAESAGVWFDRDDRS